MTLGLLEPNGRNHNVQPLKTGLEKLTLEQVIESSYDSILVTDSLGTVILVNPSTEKYVGVKAEALLGKNVKELVRAGIYDYSPTARALETNSVQSRLIRTGHGLQLFCTSTPFFNEQGKIIMVVTNARDKAVVDKFQEALQHEQKKAERYRTAVEYLSEAEHETVVAESKQMRQIIKTANIIAKTDSTTMLFGESGTGKEVLARYIHHKSNRAREAFIPVNCAAIPSELLESEFFGYVPGAFTGASSKGKPGLFEIADKGTLFLDEIGELPLAMQSKLLRVLETGEVQRVGGTSPYHTNIRLLAATNRDLKAMIEQKQFRSDLYYRLNVIPISLPPLRERPEDIVELAERFLKELNKKYALNKSLSAEVIRGFFQHSWPGNVRELRNTIERMVITSADDVIYFEDTFPSFTPLAQRAKGPIGLQIDTGGTLKSVMKQLEEQYINQILTECDGQVSLAAQRLGIHRSRLYRKLSETKD